MVAQANAAPVIIKRRKVIKGDRHHGGAWKVAYADFVTAMMAFFMLMWLLSATTEKQKTGIADYFSPTITFNRTSSGGDGMFGGESIFIETTAPKNGTGATSPLDPVDGQKRGDLGIGTDGPDEDGQSALFKTVDETLMGRGGESQVMDNILRHVITRLTDEGLVIEVFDLDNLTLFSPGTDDPTPLLEELAVIIADAAKILTNPVAVSGHVRANPIVVRENPVWDLSANRATSMRLLLEKHGIKSQRIERVAGHADRKPIVPDLMNVRNNRLEIVFLRQ